MRAKPPRSGFEFEQTSVWSVYRCPPGKTLRLSDELTDHGIACWVPYLRKSMRMPRKKIVREIYITLLPSFLFLDGDDRNLDRAQSLINQKMLPITRMRLNGLPVMCQSHEMEGLFAIHNTLADAASPLFSPGDRVSVVAGPLKDRIGVVDTKLSEHYLVLFGESSIPIKIGALLLRKIEA